MGRIQTEEGNYPESALFGEAKSSWIVETAQTSASYHHSQVCE
jgi:hypothetical protein